MLWPPRPDSSALGVPIRSDNEASVVLEVGAGEGRLLLLAEVDSTIEARLPVDSAIAVLKVAHHGSGSSSGITLLGRARPRVAAISCGRRNPFGHPALGAIQRLEGARAAIERTDLAGALWYEADPGGIRRIDWRRDDRLNSRPEVTPSRHHIGAACTLKRRPTFWCHSCGCLWESLLQRLPSRIATPQDTRTWRS